MLGDTRRSEIDLSAEVTDP